MGEDVGVETGIDSMQLLHASNQKCTATRIVLKTYLVVMSLLELVAMCRGGIEPAFLCGF